MAMQNTNLQGSIMSEPLLQKVHKPAEPTIVIENGIHIKMEEQAGSPNTPHEGCGTLEQFRSGYVH